MPKRSVLFLVIVAAQLSIIAFLGAHIAEKARLLGNVSVNVIDEDTIVFVGEDSSYTYFYEPKPNEVVRVSPDVCCPAHAWLQEEVVYTINEDGLNDRYDYSPEKPLGAFRIISLGDSYTYGSNVSTEDNYSELLEDALNERCGESATFEVLNLGVPSYDLAYAVERYRIRGQKYDPDLVLWAIKPGDFDDHVAEIVRRQIDEHMKAAKKELTREELFELNRLGEQEARELVRERGPDWMRSFVRETFRKLNEYYAGDLVLFATSNWAWEKEPLALIDEFVRSRPGTSFERMSSELSDGGLLPDYHPSEQGHEVIADELFSHLVAENLVPCRP